MFNLSTQANLYLIVIIITTIINWICATVILKWQGFFVYALFALIFTPLFILYVYNVDCLTTGDCQIWSWVVAIFSAINLISFTVFTVFITIFASTYLPLLSSEIKVGDASITVEPTPVVTTTTTPTPVVTTTTTTPTTQTAPVVTAATTGAAATTGTTT